MRIAGLSNIDARGHYVSSLVVLAIWSGSLILNVFGTFGGLASVVCSAALLVMLLETIHLSWVTFRMTQEESQLEQAVDSKAFLSRVVFWRWGSVTWRRWSALPAAAEARLVSPHA